MSTDEIEICLHVRCWWYSVRGRLCDSTEIDAHALSATPEGPDPS